MKRRVSWVLVLLLLGAGCNLPGARGPLPAQSPGPTETNWMDEAISRTLTAFAEGVEAATLTPRPSVWLTVSLETNCRTGPGTVYDVLGVLREDQRAAVVGKNSYQDTWVIQLPSQPEVTCWLWGRYASLEGDPAGLPVIAPPPTPTPAPAFQAQYETWGVAAGFQCMMFTVTNTGPLTWESFRLDLTDTTQGYSITGSSDQFAAYDTWCAPAGSPASLPGGDSGTASILTHFPLYPVGDAFEVVLTLCSQDGLGGVCLTRTISFIL